MAPHVELARVKSLCDRPETFTRAQALYSLAKARTGPGSGFSIDDHRAALPAICALLASQELQNNDVSQEVAQRASCVTPRAFNLALRTVRQALQSAQNTPLDTPRPNRNTVRATAPKKRVATFADLGREFDVGPDHIVGMTEARQELASRAEKGSVRARKVLQPKCETLLACVIFHWACKAIKRRDVSDKKLRAAWDIDLADWKHAESIVDEECRAIKESLVRSAAATAMPTPSSTRKPSKKDDLMANLLRGSDPKAKVVAEDADSPSKENVTPQTSSSPAPAVRFIGAPLRAPLPVSQDESLAQRSPSKRKAEDSSPTSDSDLASPRKRQFAPTTPSKLRAALTNNADDEASDEGEPDAGPSKQNLKAKLLEAAERAPSQTPTTARRYIGQRPPNFLPSPSASPLKASTPTKERDADSTPTKAVDATPTKSSTAKAKAKPKAYPASLSKLTDTPTKKKTKTKTKISKPTRRVTRAASRAGIYYESSSDSELDLSDDEALADPSRNLFTQAVVSDDEAPADSDVEDGAMRRRTAALARGGTARLLMRGGQRVERVFRDRQALLQVEPVLAAKLRAWKRAQAALEASTLPPGDPTQQQQQRKRKARPQ